MLSSILVTLPQADSQPMHRLTRGVLDELEQGRGAHNPRAPPESTPLPSSAGAVKSSPATTPSHQVCC